MAEEHPAGQNSKPRNRFLALAGNLDRGLGIMERLLIGGSVLAMAAIMTGNVLGQIFFSSGIPGTEEVTEMLIIVMTFIGVGYGARHARHISMSAIYDQLTGGARKTLLIVICVGTGLLMFYFAWKSAVYTFDIYERGRVSSSLHFPLWIVYLALPIGFTLAGVQFMLTTVRNLTSPDIYRSFTEKEEYSDIPDQSGDATSTTGSGI